MIVQSPDASAIDFTWGIWVQGNPIVVDAEPNTIQPAAGRIMTLQPRYGAIFLPSAGSNMSVRTVAIGGTSVSYNLWKWDPQRAHWDAPFLYAVAGAFGVSPPAVGVPSAVSGFASGQQWFAQIATVAGPVTAFGYGVF